MDEKLDYFKKKILAHLDDLEQKENAEKKELKKSLIAFEMASIEKAGYPVGTIREWKGKKYIKVAPGKWKPKYDSHSCGAKMAIAALKKKIDACTDSDELMQIILENRNRFSDENGRPLPFVKELSDYISELNDKHEKGKIHSKQGNLNGKAQNADFSDFVDDFIKGGYKSDKIATLLNETPKILKDCGIPDNPITVTSTILKKILQDENNIYHGHNIAETVLKDLPNQLKNPVYVLKGKYGNKVIVTEHYVENRPVIAVLEIDRKQGRINVNSIRTVYDKKNDVFSQWISDKNNIDYENKEKSRALLQSIGLQSTEEATTPDNSNIPQNDKKSNETQSLDTIRNNYQRAKSVTGNRKTIHVGDEPPKNIFRFVSEVKDWIVNLAKATGLDITGFKHKTTEDFERHAIKKHGSERTETGRGQVAVTQEDLDNIQDVMDNPDIAVAGVKKNGKDRIVLVKNNEHGSILVEEVLSGRRNKVLNAKTFWILDKTVDEGKIKKILANTKGYDVSKIKTATPTVATSALSSSQTDEGGRNSTGKGNGLEDDSKESPDNSNVPQNDKKSSGKSSLGKTYTGKDIVITNSTEASAKNAIAKAEFNNDLENPALFVPSNPALDKIIKTMQKKRYKGSEKRAFMSEFGTCGDGFLYVTNGIQLQRVKIDGIDGLGRGVSCLKVEKTNGGYKISELVGTDDNGNRENYRYPNCPRVIPDNKTSATLDNNALKNKLDELESKGYFSFDQWGTPTNKNSDKVKRVPIDFKADGVYIGNAKIGNNDNGVSDGRMFMNVDMLKESLSDGRNSIISVGDKTKAMSISSSVGDSVIMPMNPDDSEMPSTDDFENTEQGKAYAEAKAKWGSQKAAKKGMKKSFDLFGDEIKDLDSDEEEDSKDEMDSEDEIKKAVADVLDELAHGDK